MAGLSCRLLTGTPSCRAVGGGMLVKMVSCPWGSTVVIEQASIEHVFDLGLCSSASHVLSLAIRCQVLGSSPRCSTPSIGIPLRAGHKQGPFPHTITMIESPGGVAQW